MKMMMMMLLLLMLLMMMMMMIATMATMATMATTMVPIHSHQKMGMGQILSPMRSQILVMFSINHLVFEVPNFDP